MPASPDPVASRDAIEAALDRDDVDEAIELLHSVADGLAAETGSSFRELVHRLPPEAWHHDPLIASALGRSFRAADAPRGTPALAYFAAAEEAIARTPQTPRVRLAGVLVSHAGALRTAGSLLAAGATLDTAKAVIEEGLAGALPATVRVRARWALERGVLDMHAGAYDTARDHLLAAHGLATPHLDRAERIECGGALALADVGSGHLATAEEGARESLEAAEGTTLLRSGFAAPAYLALALAAIDRGRLAEAEELLPALSTAARHTEWEPYATFATGALRATEGRPIEAIDLLLRARRGFHGWDSGGYGPDYTDLVLASQLSATGRGDEAWEMLTRLPERGHHILCPARYLASQLLAGGDLVGADAALAPCERLGDDHAERAMLEIRLLRGAIASGLGDAPVSDLNVDLALRGMAESGSRSPLGTIPRAVLRRLAVRAGTREQSHAVLALIEEIAAATAGAEEILEPLSRQERLVLAHVERDATVNAIAAALYISPNTVKTHLRRIYRKLGVTTREQAIRRARTLGLHEITRDSPVPRDERSGDV